MTDRNLIEKAADAMKNSYTPYSRFPVGAALECDDGSVFTGSKIENAALGNTLCAELSAVAGAVSAGRRSFKRLAIYSDSASYSVPCGTCRQVLWEFSPEVEVLCARSDGRYVSYPLSSLLPEPYGREQLE
ncbi:cytidine deaminase [Sporobacter termitidis DSM 10068]|uniref:Cytidine deaminase n=1 Tax=Sporobacter termitidis DSM 10068 TaxID=1123282 RepID=A0A1M5YMH5_9FIRM|nr:cytidine deaminase [Sporobacter termitidis]SHI13109.1 cytidine deaminase [Sporobacter termitidis DSM 10068]